MHQINKTSLAWLVVLACIPFILPAQTDPVPYRKGRLWGYADRETGQILLAPTLDSVGLFQNYEVVNYYPLAWVKKGERYGLVNRAGKLVLPIQEYSPLPMRVVATGFYAVERLAFGASTWEKEEIKLAALSQEFVLRPVAFFDENGRVIGEPFAFQTYTDLYGEGGKWVDPNGFDTDVDSSYWFGTTLQQIWKADKVGLFDLTRGRVVVQPAWNSIFTQRQTAIATRLTGENADGMHYSKNALIDLTTGSEIMLPDTIDISYDQGKSMLLLAMNKSSRRWGFLDRTGKTAIPFQYQAANPFSTNGLTKVLSMEGIWSVIDLTGREIIRLGRNSGFMRWADGNIWVQSDEDQLYRKKDASSTDLIGTLGFDYPPQQVKYGSRTFWAVARFRKTGLLDSMGQAILPIELDYLGTGYFSNRLPEDTTWSTRFLTVSKDNRKWIFNTSNLQPVWPKLAAGTGLTLGKTFDKSNFELLQLISGDSLAVIRLADGSEDILNIRSGQRWGISNANSFFISNQDSLHGTLISYSQNNGQDTPRRFKLNGQPVPFTREVYGEYGRGWTSGFDPITGLTTVFDSTGRSLCTFRNPFTGYGIRIEMTQNENGRQMPFVILITSEKGESAVFSPQGRLLSPPFIWQAKVSNDLIFATMNEKRGVYRLSDGKEILPCAYRRIEIQGNELSAVAMDGTESRFNKQGNMLRTYPQGYRSQPNQSFSAGFQVVYGQSTSTYINKKLKLAFPGEPFIQVRPFSDGLGVVKVLDRGWSYIRPTGKAAFEGYFFYAESFHNGYAVVRTTDNWTKIIDTLGHTVFQVPSDPSTCAPTLAQLGQTFFLDLGPLHQIITPEGTMVLKNCSCVTLNPKNDTIAYHCDQRLGRLLPGGRISWIEKSDYRLEHDQYRGTRSVLPGFNCPAEGLQHPTTGVWLVEPRAEQEITLPEEFPQWAFVTDLITQHRIIVNRYSGEIIPVDPYSLQRLEDNLGWLYFDENAKTALLFSPDLQTKKPWNYLYRNIQWREELGLYEVATAENKLVGYIAKNGRFFFED